MISEESVIKYTQRDAYDYCKSLNTANGGTGTACEKEKGNIVCDATVYTGWRLPSLIELKEFLGYSISTNSLWTSSYYEGYGNYFYNYRLSDGFSNLEPPYAVEYIRCVR